MKKNKVKTFLIFLLVAFLMFILPSIPLIILGINPEKLSKGTEVIYSFGFNIIAIVSIFLIFKDDIIKDFKNYFKKFFTNFELSFKYYIVGFAFMVLSNITIVLFFKGATANNEEAIRSLMTSFPLYMFFSVAIYAPFAEEMLFRKCIKDFILSFGDNLFTKYFYIFVSGFIFALLHIVSMATGLIDYIYIFPYLGLGCAFAALYQKTDNIFSTIMVHAMHNTLAILLYIALGIV